MTGAAAARRPPPSTAAAALYVVRVVESVDERIAGHRSCAYASPAQSRNDAHTLVQLLLGGAAPAPDANEEWTCTVAAPGGRRTVTLVPADTCDYDPGERTSPSADECGGPDPLPHRSRELASELKRAQ